MLIIFKGARQVMNSDAATALIVANEQITQGKFFPEGWVNADSFWVISLNVFIVPFMLFLDDWILCRRLAVFVQLICILAVLTGLGRRLSRRGRILPFLFLIPLSPTILEHFFFQATYATHIIWYFLVILCVFFIVENGWKRRGHFFVCAGVILVLTALLETSGVRHLVTFSAPLMGSLLLVGYQQWRETESPKEGTAAGSLFCVLCAGVGVFVGMVANFLLGQSLILVHGTSDAAISQGYEILYRFGDAVGNILTVFGAVDYGTLVSVNGIFKFLRAIYCFFLIVYVPAVLWRRYANLKVFQKIFYVYAMLSFMLTMYVNVFTDIGHARYFLMTYVNSLVLLVIWFDAVPCDRLVRGGILLAAAVTGLYCYRHYLVYDYQENVESVGYYPWIRNQEELLECLEEEDLDFGYATYWQAYNLMALTSGKVQMLAVEDDLSEGLEPYYWLTNVNWYEEDYHTGKSFLLLTDEEMELIDSDLTDAADKVLECGEYHILIYSYDVLDEEAENGQ